MKVLVAVVSDSTIDHKQRSDQQRALTLLETTGVEFERLSGDEPSLWERRDKLFAVSGIHAKYPQFFVEDNETKDIKYIGQLEDLQALADGKRLTSEGLGLVGENPPPEVETVPAAAEEATTEIQNGESTPQPEEQKLPALATWGTSQENVVGDGQTTEGTPAADESDEGKKPDVAADQQQEVQQEEGQVQDTAEEVVEGEAEPQESGDMTENTTSAEAASPTSDGRPPMTDFGKSATTLEEIIVSDDEEEIEEEIVDDDIEEEIVDGDAQEEAAEGGAPEEEQAEGEPVEDTPANDTPEEEAPDDELMGGGTNMMGQVETVESADDGDFGNGEIPPSDRHFIPTPPDDIEGHDDPFSTESLLASRDDLFPDDPFANADDGFGDIMPKQDPPTLEEQIPTPVSPAPTPAPVPAPAPLLAPSPTTIGTRSAVFPPVDDTPPFQQTDAASRGVDLEEQSGGQMDRSRPDPGYARLEAGKRAKERAEKTAKADCLFHFLIFVLVALVCGAAAAVVVIYEIPPEDEQGLGPLDNDGGDEMQPRDVQGRTTFFDPMQPGNCDFSGLTQPHVVDQCACNGAIFLVADDVRERYERHLEEFIPTAYGEYPYSISSCAAPNQALVWLASGNDYDFLPEERRERFALAAMFASTLGATWFDRSGWLSSEDVCSWKGVTCDTTGFVNSLDLRENNLTGPLPREIVLLVGLIVIKLPNNNINGGIPQEIFFINGIQDVDLSSNQLSQSIPQAINGAANLAKFNIENNDITGTIPELSLVALESLNVGLNRLKGNLPTGLFSLPLLADLQIHENSLTGTIPLEIGQATTLTTLVLGPSSFTGTLQMAIDQLTNLQKLVVESVPVRGSLPASFGTKLTNLKELVISETGIVGEIPASFGDLVQLQTLDLSDNGLRSTIPTTLGLLAMLRELDLSDNTLTGNIPTEFNNLLALQTLRLDGNQITGRVSADLCELRQIELEELIIDCAEEMDGMVTGVLCAVGTCCTACRSATA